MVVEHVFVTTLPADVAMKRSREFLVGRGFSEGAKGFEVISDQASLSNSLDMKRGKKSIRKVKQIIELPQQLLMQWDRGRVTVAASISNYTSDRSYALGGNLGRNYSSKRSLKVQADLLVTIASALELLLVNQQTPAEAGVEWGAVEQKILDRHRQATIFKWVAVGIFLALIVGVIILAATSK